MRLNDIRKSTFYFSFFIQFQDIWCFIFQFVVNIYQSPILWSWSQYFRSIFDKTVLFVFSLHSVIPSTLGLFWQFTTRYFRSSKWYGSAEIFIWRYRLEVRKINQSHQCFEIFEWLELCTCLLYHIVNLVESLLVSVIPFVNCLMPDLIYIRI